MATSLTFGIIGAGRIGNVHAESLSYRIGEATVVAIADPRVEAAQEAACRFHIGRAGADPGDIIADPTIDAVVICSSTETHAELIVQAAQSGKQIFCEKPIALSLPAIDRALDAVEQAGVKLQIGFNRRFDANVRRLRAAVSEGVIGRPHLVRITSRDPSPPPLDYIRVSGGMFLDMTIHDFDLARYLVGQEVDRIYATGSALLDAGIGEAGDIDTAVVTMEYDNGGFCIIDNSRQAVYGYDQRVEVFGSAGSVESRNRTPDQVVTRTGAAITTAKPLYFFLERYMDSYVEEMRAFMRAIAEDSEPMVTGVDGRIPVVMGLAAQRSLREGRPVRLREIEATA